MNLYVDWKYKKNVDTTEQIEHRSLWEKYLLFIYEITELFDNWLGWDGIVPNVRWLPPHDKFNIGAYWEMF
jgi:hypothetical protein